MPVNWRKAPPLADLSWLIRVTPTPFLKTQLKPQELQSAFDKSGLSLQLRMQRGYDHSYYFIASFMGDHLRHHAQLLSP